jgi:hypothetical protein
MSSDGLQAMKQRILHGYCVRVHMALIVAAVVASGVLSSKLMLVTGVHSLRFRYPVAVALSYGVFLLLVRVWIWYVTLRRPVWAGSSSRTSDLDIGVWGGGGGGGGGGVRFGGGSSGGAGASDSWAEGDSSMPIPVAQASSGHGSFFSNLDLGGGDDDGWLVMVLLIALVLAIFGAGGYLVFAAPQILPEAACQAILAPALLRVSKEHHHGWMSGVFRSTVLPFAIVCVFATALGWVAHRACPTAPRLMDVWNCPTR